MFYSFGLSCQDKLTLNSTEYLSVLTFAFCKGNKVPKSTDQSDPNNSRKVKSSTNKYANSRPIDLNWDSQHPSVENLVEELKAELFDNGMYERIPNSRELKRVHNHIKILLLDLYLAYLSDPTLYLGYSRTKGDYKLDGKYNYQCISYSIFIKRVVDGLYTLNYIEGKIGFHDDPNEYGWQSRMKATEELIQKFSAYNLTREMISRNKKEEIIILRDKLRVKVKTKKGIRSKNVKIDIPYRNTRKVKQLRKNLRYINDVLEKTFIGLYIPDNEFEELRNKLRYSEDREPINFSNKRLRRIFNNRSWEQGGRFYGGWWQLIPKEYRKFIRVSRDEFGSRPKALCVEYDYNAQHARMLYAKVGIDCGDKDPYEIEGFDEGVRKILKRAFNIIVNTKSEKRAIRSLNDRIEEDEWILPSGISGAEDIVRLIIENHQPIKDLLFSTAGPNLQYLDSKIAEKIMLKMFKRGAIVLPVHDSFLVSISWEVDIKPVMERIFFEEVGVHCPALRKETMYEANNRINPPENIEDSLEANNLLSNGFQRKMNKEYSDYSIYYSMENAYRSTFGLNP